MPTTPQLEFGSLGVTRQRKSRTKSRPCVLGFGYVLLVVTAAVLPLPAQVLSPPPRLEPTTIALDEIRQCAKNISSNAPDISSDLLNAQQDLTSGLLKGGYSKNQATGGSGYNRGGNYKRQGDWLLVPAAEGIC